MAERVRWDFGRFFAHHTSSEDRRGSVSACGGLVACMAPLEASVLLVHEWLLLSCIASGPVA